VGDPTNQAHDFEPGIKSSGLFWTIPLPASGMTADPSTGAARYTFRNLAVPDFHDFFNAVSPFPSSRPGHVSFDVRWAGGGESTEIDDPVFGFEGSYVQSDATISFRVYDDARGAVIYTSDPGGQVTVGSGVGSERNGVFFG
jgi:hypothetical protein